MPSTRTSSRRRMLLAILTSATLALGLVNAPAASADGGYRAKLLRIVNATRARHDLRKLKLVKPLSRVSRKHSATMIRRNRIFDPPNLEEILSQYRWDDLGADVVGCGSTLYELHTILMSEDFHRTIILHPKLRRVGIGVVRADENNRCGRNSFWATEIFFG